VSRCGHDEVQAGEAGGIAPAFLRHDHGCFMQVPPVQLSPTEHECPQLPQLLLSEMNDALLTHWPMHEV